MEILTLSILLVFLFVHDVVISVCKLAVGMLHGCGTRSVLHGVAFCGGMAALLMMNYLEKEGRDMRL